MFSTALSYTLEAAYREAVNRHHLFFCVEHLLYALLFDEEVSKTIHNCGGCVPEIRRDLEEYFDKHAERMSPIAIIEECDLPESGPVQTPAIQRVLQRAIMQKNFADKGVVTGGDVLAQIFLEKDTHAVYFLEKQNIEQIDVINYISHGVTKIAQREGEQFTPAEGDDSDVGHQEKGDRKKRSALEQFCEDLTALAKSGELDPVIGR
ncbi:MAG: hypothetical protein GX589_08600, partial [Deltaproteobacteria bacterium]|nr:hypothetical protein [Deltaproteobacteria bacterium]